MEKIKIIILFGESCAGKDTIQNWIVSHCPETHKMISCTTRAKRTNETEGRDYFFLSNDKFAEKVLNGEMIEATSYDGEFYGTSTEAFKSNKINIGVMDIRGIEILLQDPRFDVLPVYVAAMPLTRLTRATLRDPKADATAICNRYLGDLSKFADIPFDFVTLFNDTKLMKNDVFEDAKKIIKNFGQK